MLSKSQLKTEQPTLPLYTEPFLWIPARGPDFMSVAGYFPKPQVPLGEAWFIGGDRRLFHDLNQFGVEGTPDKHLSNYFFELLGGLGSFADLPDWSEWYAYLLPRVLDKDVFFLDLANGLILLSQNGKEHPAAQSEPEFAAILSRWIMSPKFWKSGVYSPYYVEGYQDICSIPWGEPSVYYDISVSLFLCWRYLPADAIGPWLHSVLDIEDVNWRKQIMAWLLGIQPLTKGGAVTLETLSLIKIENFWPDSHRWRKNSHLYTEQQKWEFIHASNVAALRAAVRAEFSEAVYFAWIDQFAAQTHLWPQSELLIEQFQAAYLTEGNEVESHPAKRSSATSVCLNGQQKRRPKLAGIKTGKSKNGRKTTPATNALFEEANRLLARDSSLCEVPAPSPPRLSAREKAVQAHGATRRAEYRQSVPFRWRRRRSQRRFARYDWPSSQGAEAVFDATR